MVMILTDKEWCGASEALKIWNNLPRDYRKPSDNTEFSAFFPRVNME